ncbi:MAG: cholesterol oxidase substrate-binding domain-containing protein, partial [Pseudomonadota bacterium]
MPDKPSIQNPSRRQFLKRTGISFTAISLSTLPMSFMLTGCTDGFYKVTYENWSLRMRAKNVRAYKPTATENLNETLPKIAAWALENDYTLRAIGSMHNWSPFAMGEDDDPSAILLIDLGNITHTSMDYEGDEYGIVRAGTGIHTTKFYEYLNTRRRGNGTAPGYALMHTPAPGDITLGGMLAIGGHGTGVDVPGSDEPKRLNGSVSNMVLSLTALVWNNESKAYELREFKRGDGIIDVLMVGLGRIIITEVTMQVVPNYNLRCISRFDISADELFNEKEEYSENTIASLTRTHGRMEVIWFPYTNNPWLKVWKYSPTKPKYSVATT